MRYTQTGPTNSNNIQILYHPGMFGNLVRFILDRSLPDTKLKHIQDPFTSDKNVHQSFEYSDKFSNSHQVSDEKYKFLLEKYPFLSKDSRRPSLGNLKIIITFDNEDEIFAHRCNFYRSPWIDKKISNIDFIVHSADPKFVSETFRTSKNKFMIAKELKKIEFHAQENIWSLEYKKFINNKNYYYLNIRSLLDDKKLYEEIDNISNFFDLKLKIDHTWIKDIVRKFKTIKPVDTIDRCNDVYNATIQSKNIPCDNLDIIEQAWIETQLEKNHNGLIFPYGTLWFKNTEQINEFIETYPSYLKHMNPRLPWYNNIKNPYYLKGKID